MTRICWFLAMCATRSRRIDIFFNAYLLFQAISRVKTAFYQTANVNFRIVQCDNLTWEIGSQNSTCCLKDISVFISLIWIILSYIVVLDAQSGYTLKGWKNIATARCEKINKLYMHHLKCLSPDQFGRKYKEFETSWCHPSWGW